ncbi:MAG: DEAD/DEAH box helicase family protein [Chloroflexi bacterium]|nr:DEAD/DEAH box helicase family protein [Chloroflexota bacterium]
MTFDFSKIKVTGQQAKPTDPIEIFQGAAITDGSINDLWLGQGDALRGWHTNRDKDDVAVVLNTGAGKTLVGLLIAQSLVNETKRQVVYACSSIQLVEQTAAKAQGYGLPAATYFRQGFSQGDLYHRAEAPCVTTYQALFNGWSRFRSDDIAAVIFDDAHTADQILRDQFSLSITRGEMTETFDQILALFQPYHNSVGLASSFAEVINGEASREFLVPPFEIQRNLSELRRLLVEAGLGERRSTMFEWEHIRDHEDLCCLLISNREVTLTPPVAPVFSLPYFRNGVRRIYLSATLSAPDSFVRAFGRQPDEIISPSTTAGECERMILIPRAVEGVDDDLASAKEVIADHKALILVPSYYRSEKWADIAAPPPRESVSEAIGSFREAKPPAKLTLAARYDGLDLPGDTCRMMVLDELPQGAGPLERFQWERLNMQNSFRSLLASRIVQSFGRISRGMSDHGVVLITGRGLVEWLLVPRNRALLPRFLQKQMEIGEQLSKGASGTGNLKSIASACLARGPEWIQAYTNNMRDLPSDGASTGQDKALDIALAEARFGKALWDRDYEGAAAALNAVLEEAFEFSQFSGAWLSFWLGYSLEMSGDHQNASYFYRKACANQSNMPRSHSVTPSTGTSVPAQVTRISEQMRIGHSDSLLVQPPRTLVQDLTPLNGNGSSAQVEEAIRCLGQYLGLRSTRPDKEYGTGPDVLWMSEEGYAACIEVKTDKQSSSYYRKEDVGQLHNHIQWVKDNHEVSQTVPTFVGPLVPPSKEASPSPDMKVIELQQFHELSQRLIAALQDVAQRALPLSLEHELSEAMKSRNLLYPKVFASLYGSSLEDIPGSS